MPAKVIKTVPTNKTIEVKVFTWEYICDKCGISEIIESINHGYEPDVTKIKWKRLHINDAPTLYCYSCYTARQELHNSEEYKRLRKFLEGIFYCFWCDDGENITYKIPVEYEDMRSIKAEILECAKEID